MAGTQEAAKVLDLLITLAYATETVDLQALYYVKLIIFFFQVPFRPAEQSAFTVSSCHKQLPYHLKTNLGDNNLLQI